MENVKLLNFQLSTFNCFGCAETQMFIENRINKRNETDSCILILLNENHREKLVRQND